MEQQLRNQDNAKIDNTGDKNLVKPDLDNLVLYEESPYALGREYMNDVYQAIERGKLENDTNFKGIL